MPLVCRASPYVRLFSDVTVARYMVVDVSVAPAVKYYFVTANAIDWLARYMFAPALLSAVGPATSVVSDVVRSAVLG